LNVSIRNIFELDKFQQSVSLRASCDSPKFNVEIDNTEDAW